MRHIRSQAAMEYLMTYGWAVIIIAVVLGALFSLGVFSSANLVPRAQPGNCRVARLAGMANLEGVCQGEMPEFVGQFNGQSSYVDAGNPPPLSLSAFTLVAWIKATPDVADYRTIIDKTISPVSTTDRNYWLDLTQTTGDLELRFSIAGTGQVFTSSSALNDNKWHQVIAAYSGSRVTLYVDGASVYSVLQSGTPDTTSNDLMIGQQQTNARNFNGLISNIQIYNTSLDANQINALYIEGIGGAPVDPYHIVGWWPLNGNGNDYSGNNNNGAATNVVYSSQWMSGYIQP